MARIALVVGDAASGEFLTPVYPRLVAAGHQVEVFADPDRNMAGGKVLEKSKVPVVPATELPIPQRFDLVVCGTAFKAVGLVRTATIAAQMLDCPVIWAGDLYGSGCEQHMLDLKPDRLTAIDGSAVEWIRRMRPAYPEDRIVVTGNPAFDCIPQLVAKRQDLRAKINLGPQEHLVVLGCSDSGQFDRHEMEKTLAEVSNTCVAVGSTKCVIMFHPADKQREELMKWAEQNLEFTQVKDRLTGDSLADLIAADVAVVQYSLLGVQASMAVPTLFVLLPSMRKYQVDNRGATWADKFYPQIKHWVAMAAWDAREVAPTLGRLLRKEPGFHEAMQEARETHFKSLVDGKSTDRFVGLVNTVLKKGG